MTLNLHSCARVHESGFSKSECLELARRIEQGDLIEQWFECAGCGTDNLISGGASVTDRATIVAALRAFAG